MQFAALELASMSAAAPRTIEFTTRAWPLDSSQRMPVAGSPGAITVTFRSVTSPPPPESRTLSPAAPEPVEPVWTTLSRRTEMPFTFAPSPVAERRRRSSPTESRRVSASWSEPVASMARCRSVPPDLNSRAVVCADPISRGRGLPATPWRSIDSVVATDCGSLYVPGATITSSPAAAPSMA